MNQGIAGDVAAVMSELQVSGLMEWLCTVQMPDGVSGPSGAASGNFVNLDGHVNLQCRVAPLSIGDRVQPTEMKEIEEIMSRNPKHVSLAGFYPAIISGYRVILTSPTGDTSTNEVFGTESDGFDQQTRLSVSEISI